MTADFSDDDLAALFAAAAEQDHIAIAVSGGGDSMALLHLADQWRRRRDVALLALTVDHGLRPESAAEAASVAVFCKARDIPHTILHWQRGEDSSGNLSDAARAGRYRAMAAVCKEQGINMLLTGHTLDDQAETVLMRLGRGSGVDGLVGMRRISSLWNLQLFRPLLGIRRANLRDTLRGAGVAWADDPTNEDRGYTRILARDALESLASLGITPDRLAATAAMMEDARNVLEDQANALEKAVCLSSPLGYVLLDPVPFVDAARETARRLLARLLCRISGNPYRPRLDALVSLIDRVQSGGFTGATLHGCRIDRAGDRIVIQREPSACMMVTSPACTGLWDNRFHFDIPDALAADPTLHVAATGENGLRRLKAGKHAAPASWSAAPRPARACTPALWRGDTLLAAPLAQYAETPDLRECRVLLSSEPHISMVDPVNEDFI